MNIAPRNPINVRCSGGILLMGLFVWGFCWALSAADPSPFSPAASSSAQQQLLETMKANGG